MNLSQSARLHVVKGMGESVTPIAAMVGRLLDSLESSGGNPVVVRSTDGRSARSVPAWDHSVERMLVRSACDGDDDALELLMRREWCGIFRLVSRYEPDVARAEDLVQEVFTRAIATLGRVQDLGIPLRSHLSQIARRLLRDRLGSARGGPSRGVPGAFGVPSPPDLVVLPAQERRTVPAADDEPTVVVLSEDERRRFLAALDRLPRRSRELLWSRVVEGRTETEIGIDWGRTAESVREAQRHALDALLASLADDGEGAS